MSGPQWAPIHGRRIEFQWFEPSQPVPHQPVIAMLHEGLGSLSMWKEFPQRLAEATGSRVMAYSHFGYGRSDALPDRCHALEMHKREACEVLPRLVAELGICRPVLFGHSDGASIAIIHAGTFPGEVAGVAALAPHVFVEDMCIASIEAARQTYLTTDLRERLGRYHDDADGAFRQWNDLWLDPAFRRWNIERYLPAMHCPLLAIQGLHDEYGTLEQLDRLMRSAPQAQILTLAQCGHSPHRDQPARVLKSTVQWIRSTSLVQSES